jgi:membrane fusion protein, multidrug efflux system
MANEIESGSSRNRSRLLFVVGIVVVAGSLLLLSGLLWSKHTHLKTEEKSRADAQKEGPRVKVATATKAEELRPVVFTGEARPYASVTLYAKISGYLQEIRVDKGDRVEADYVIAIIDSPELRRQYAAALADAKNKRADAERSKALLETGAVSQQNADTSETTARVAEETAQALKVQKDYEVMRAPFAGIITARFADPGALLQGAVTAQTTALPIVTLAQTDRLRVYAYPDQKTASLVQVGDRAEVADATRREVKLDARVSRTSGELDPKTRTLLVEIEVDNGSGAILAGSFVEVTLFIRIPPCVQVPARSLVMRGKEAYVGIVTQENTVELRAVTIYDSDGKMAWLHAGLSEGERVLATPAEHISEGAKVQPVSE